MSDRPTIKDVAREARVSHATVSYILNNNWHASRISEDTKNRVLDAVQKLGYRSNPLGRALKRGYTSQVMLLIVTWDLATSHAATAMAVSRAAVPRDMEVLVHVADSDAAAESFLRRKVAHSVGGMLLLWDSPAVQESMLNKLAAEGLPVVDLLPGEHQNISVVSADREDAGLQATRHLIELGHRTIGMIGDTSTRPQTTLRKMMGYRKALEEAEIAFDEDLVQNVTEFGYEGGVAGMRELLGRRPDLTALFCINDPIAMGALVAAEELGRPCPSSISVVGYGAAHEGLYWRPPVTTLSLSAEKVAERSLQLIADQRAANQQSPENIYIPEELIVRGSTGPAPL